MKKTLVTILLTLIVFINLLPDTLTSFNGYRIPVKLVSWDSGVVLNQNGDGVITSPYTDSYYNYIKYDSGLETGTQVFTIYAYNPLTLYNDDIVLRFDFWEVKKIWKH